MAKHAIKQRLAFFDLEALHGIVVSEKPEVTQIGRSRDSGMRYYALDEKIIRSHQGNSGWYNGFFSEGFAYFFNDGRDPLVIRPEFKELDFAFDVGMFG